MKQQASSMVECPASLPPPSHRSCYSHRSLCLHCPQPREDCTDRRRGFPQRLEIHGATRLEGMCGRVCWDHALCVSGLRRCGVRRISPTRSWCALEAIFHSPAKPVVACLSVFRTNFAGNVEQPKVVAISLAHGFIIIALVSATFKLR